MEFDIDYVAEVTAIILLDMSQESIPLLEIFEQFKQKYSGRS